MRQSVGAEFGHRSAGEFDHIVGGRESFGHSVAGEVGDSQQNLLEALGALVETVLKTFGGSLQLGDTLLGLLGLLFLTALHERSDRGGELLELRGVAVTFCLKATALGVDLQNLGDGGSAVKPLDGQALDHEVRLLS